MVKYEPTRDVVNTVSSTTYKNVYAELHFHRSVELIYVHEGRIRVRSGLKEFVVEQGEIAFVPEYFAHNAVTLGEGKATNFIIPYNYYKQFLARGVKLYYSHLDNKAVNSEIWKVIEQAQPRLKEGGELLAQGYASVVLGLIAANYTPENLSHGDNDFVIKLVDYIERNFAADLTLERVAQDFGYSKYYFSRLFNRGFGCTLNHYINQVRYNHVVSNMGGEGNLSSLILAAGFNDISTFYKYKKRMEERRSHGV